MATKDDLEYLGRLKARSIELSVPPKSMNLHQQKVAKTLEAKKFGCRSDLVQKFASAFMNFNFNNSSILRSGAVIISTEEVLNYTANSPSCLITTTQGFVLELQDAGSPMSGYIEKFRLATSEEIEFFYSEVVKTNLEKFLKYMNDHSGMKR